MILVIIGGVFMILGAVAEIWVGAVLETAFFGNYGGILIWSGLPGIAVGAFVLVMGVLVYLQPRNHTIYGVLILVLSIVSLASFYGGFFLGFVLGLVGGILAIVHNPEPISGPIQYVMAPPIQRVCTKCGRVVDLNMRFCPHCGNPLG